MRLNYLEFVIIFMDYDSTTALFEVSKVYNQLSIMADYICSATKKALL